MLLWLGTSIEAKSPLLNHHTQTTQNVQTVTAKDVAVSDVDAAAAAPAFPSATSALHSALCPAFQSAVWHALPQ